MRAAAGLFAALLLGAGSSSAQPRADGTSACLRDQDRAMCLLKVAAGDDGGSTIWRDRDLRDQPAILSALGLTAHGVAAARGANAGERLFFAAGDEGEAAAAEALALDRAGRPPAEALAPILALSTASPALPPFFMGQGELPSPRAEAYQRLLASAESLASPPSPRLGMAATDAWERDLRDPSAPPMFRSSAYGLTMARWALRDDAGADRAIALIASPFTRIELLTLRGRFEDAVRAALTLDRAEAAALVRAEMSTQVERMMRAQDAAARAAVLTMPDEMRRQGLADDPEVAKALRKMAAEEQRAARRPLSIPRISDAEVRAEVENRIGVAQDGVLLAALRKQRAEQVRPLADHLLQDANLPDNRYRFPRALRAATPEVAIARLDALDAALSPKKGAGRLEPLVQAWIQVGRPERAEQLLDRAAGWARAASPSRPSPYAEPAARLLWSRGRQAEATAIAVLSPVEKLELDIAAGRGLAGFDTYLAAADDSQRNSLVVHCTHAATKAKAWATVVECSERRRVIYTGAQQRYAHADMAMEAAAHAADADELAAANRLFAIAVESRDAAIAAEPQTTGWPDPFTPPRLLSIAKAELRANGRLPKSPPPPRP